MRKKFVQTLAAQQLQMSNHIRTNDMEKEKEQTCGTSQQPKSNASDTEVIEILDDDNDVELMMERHRKYHPRKYVNLQQPPSKIYYDQIEKPISPTPDREDQDMEEEEDEERQLVIDCVRDTGPQIKETNNNSMTTANGNHTEERDSNGEQSGPISFRPIVPETNTADSDQQTTQNAAAPLSGAAWHVPQNRMQVPFKIPEFRPPIQPRENVVRTRPGTPAPRMMMERQHVRPTPYHLVHRPHPYERPATNSHGAALEDRINAGTTHPSAMENHETSNEMMSNFTLGSSAAAGRNSAKHQGRNAMIPPPPPLMPSMPGTVSSVAIAPRTPYYHNPYLQPYHHYQAYSTNPPDRLYHTLEEWYRAGYPAPHMLSSADLQFYYHCFLSKMLFTAAFGYHQQHQQQQHHEQLYRNYPALAMTPGNAFYPPPQYGFVKPIPVTAVSVSAAPTPVAAPASAPVDSPANPSPRPIDFSQHHSGSNVPASGAGYLPTTLPLTSTAQTHQSHQRLSHTPYPTTQSEHTRCSVTPAIGYSSTTRPSSTPLMSPPSTMMSPSSNHSPTASSSTLLSSPSRMLASSSMPAPTIAADSLSPKRIIPPSRADPTSNTHSPGASMPPPSFILSPSSIPLPSNHPPTNMASHTTTTTSSTMVSPNSLPRPTNHCTTNMYSLSNTTSTTRRMLTAILSTKSMSPPSNHPPFSVPFSPSTTTPTTASPNSMPPPSNYPPSILFSPSTTASGVASSGTSPPPSNHPPYNGFTTSYSPTRSATPFPGSMPPPSNHPPLNMGSPTSPLLTSSMPSESYHPPSSMTSLSTAASSTPVPESKVPPPTYDLQSSDSMLPPGNHPPPNMASATTPISTSSTPPASSRLPSSMASPSTAAFSTPLPEIIVVSPTNDLQPSYSTPPPSNCPPSKLFLPSTTASGVPSSGTSPPPSNHPPYNGFTTSYYPTRSATPFPGSMPPPNNHPPSSMHSPSKTFPTVLSPGSMPCPSHQRSSNISAPSTSMHPPSFILSPGRMSRLSHQLTTNMASNDSTTSTMLSPNSVHSSSIASMSPDSMPPPSNHPPPNMASPTTPMSTSSMPSASYRKPSSMATPSTVTSFSAPLPEKTVHPPNNHLQSSDSMPPPSNHPPSNMDTPTSPMLPTSMPSASYFSPSSMTSLSSAASSKPLPESMVHPPTNHLQSSMPSPSTILSSNSMSPSRAHLPSSMACSPTTSSSMTSPISYSLPIMTSPSTMIPPTISYTPQHMPTVVPAISAPSSMPSPSTIPSSVTTSSAVSPATMMVQPYTHYPPGSMPSLDTIDTSASMPPPSTTLPPPSTIPSPSASRQLNSGQQQPVQPIYISAIISPPAARTDTSATKSRGRGRKPSTTANNEPSAENPAPPTPKRRGRRASVAASQSPYISNPSLPSLPPTPRPPPIASPADTSLNTGSVGPMLTHVRREMIAFLQHRRADIVTTMRIYTIGRMDFGAFLCEMKRYNVCYRDFMHVAFTLMRRCGYGGFAKDPPPELDYKWPSPPQEFVNYFSNIKHCTSQFVADNFDFLLLVVDNLLQQYFDPMEYFLLTYVLGVNKGSRK